MMKMTINVALDGVTRALHYCPGQVMSLESGGDHTECHSHRDIEPSRGDVI